MKKLVVLILALNLLNACVDPKSPQKPEPREKPVKTVEVDASAPGSDSNSSQTKQGNQLPIASPIGPDQLVAPANLPPPKAIPASALAYDMNGTLSRASPRAAVFRAKMQNVSLIREPKLILSATLTNLRASNKQRVLSIPVSMDSQGIIDHTITDLEPETVYRLDGLSLASATQPSLKASSKDPYFLMSSGPSSLAIARRAIVMRALNEAYDWDHGVYETTKRYADSSGWCDRFYSWSASHYFKINYPDFAPPFFEDYNQLVSAAKIPEIANVQSVSGDMIRYDGIFLGNHTFMIVAYDTAKSILWTVEGNFNNRVERSKRSINSAWKLGHLGQNMVR